MTYEAFFELLTGQLPYPYQVRVAPAAPSVLDVPTGLGKTEAIVVAWLYRRMLSPEETPRRLLYCLPMRSLVEQTRDRVSAILDRLEAARSAGTVNIDVPASEVVMGGQVGEQWFRSPEMPSIVIGTQDMLLSRALNRGYAMSRYQWPMAFGAANDDAYWVIDEVQLQGIGAVTAAQLQAFRERLGTYHRSELTLASATIDAEWFETADFSLHGKHVVSIDGSDRENVRIRKRLEAAKRLEGVAVGDKPEKAIAALAQERHRPGSLTLVVVNRVKRAQSIYRELQRLAPETELVLLHSRYRPRDRKAHLEALLRPVDAVGPGKIVVATQVIEAGIDISASVLLTDLAPWDSIVQRFGRCNRYGEHEDARCYWFDSGDIKTSDVQPYNKADLENAQSMLRELEGASVAPIDLKKCSIPLREGLVLRKPELLDLFDTAPDLAGHDVDVSPYIRVGDESGVSLLWREEPPTDADPPRADELCPAPISDVRSLIERLRSEKHADFIRLANAFAQREEAAWIVAQESDLRPGAIVWLYSKAGGYDQQRGFDPAIAEPVEPTAAQAPSRDFSECCERNDGDPLATPGVAITLTQHAQDTRGFAEAIVEAVGIPADDAAAVCTAALWHDTGKVHEVFQDTMKRANAGIAGDGVVWAKGTLPARHGRPGFRHELPGALAYREAAQDHPDVDLVSYLIAAHHGKVRVSARQFPYEAPLEPFQLLGIRDGEVLPSADLGSGVVSPVITLSLDAFRIGTRNGERTWIEMTDALRSDSRLGPFRLAYLELLVRIADWRASAYEAEKRA